MIKAWRARTGSALDDGGFTIVEVMVAMTILAMLAMAFGLTMNATVRTYVTTRNKTLAEQLATEQTEDARRIDYDALGTAGGSPPGTLPPTKNWDRDGRTFTVTTEVDYVDDPVPPPDGYQTYANYKRVRVTVRLAGTTKVLADLETLIAPPLQPNQNKAVVKVQVLDYGNNTVMPGATVQIAGGPSPIQTKLTNSGGNAIFPQLDPNATSGTVNRYYDVNVTNPGYEVLPENRPPAAVARPVLEAREVFPSTISIYKPMRVTVNMVNPAGDAYPGTATVAISAPTPRASGNVALTGPTADVTAVNGESIIPSVSYTFQATTPDGTGAAVTKTIGATGYPNVLTDSVTLPVPYQRTTLSVKVTDQKNGNNVVGATVQLTAGPLNLTTPRTAVTNSSGVASFANTEVSPSKPWTVTVPAQSGFNAATTTTTVAALNPATVNMTLQRGTTQLNVTVLDDFTSQPVAGAVVKVTGGPYAETLPDGTTDATGKVSFGVYTGGANYTVTVPAGAGYAQAVQAVTVTPPGPAAVTMRVAYEKTTLSVKVTDQTNGANVVGATVQLTGGPLNVTTPRTALTNSSGVATFSDTEISASKPWTITIPAQNGYGAATTATTVAAANPPTVSMVLQRGTTQLNVTLVDDSTSQPVANRTVQVTGGPYAETLPDGTSDGTGKTTFGVYTGGTAYSVTVPASAGYDAVTQSVPVPGPGATDVTIRLIRNIPKVNLEVTVRDNVTSDPVTNALVQVTGGPYNETLPSQRTGILFNPGKTTFSVHVSPTATYTVTVPGTATYQVNVTTILVPGPGATAHTVRLVRT